MRVSAPDPLVRCSVSWAGPEQRREIYRIRHDVYARELGQHPENEREALTDPLDDHNLYLVARARGVVVGFVSLTPPPGPYSLDKYLRREQWPVQAGPGTYEVRLLTVTAAARGTLAAGGLMYAAVRYVQWRGGAHVVALGREQVLPMYRKAGMKPCGLQVSSGAVRYHVMAAEVAALLGSNAGFLRRVLPRLDWQLEFPARAPAGCFHGGASIAEAGSRFERLGAARQVVNADVLDAWFDPSPKVIEALREHLAWMVKTSPPADCQPLRAAIAEARGVPAEALAPGAGSSDLIFRCFRHWLAPKSRVLLLDPTYGEYAHVLERVIGCRPERLRLDPAADFALNLAALAERLRKPYDLVVLVNPNSPTGTFARREALGPLLVEASSRGTRLWVDETYIEYVGQAESLERLAAATPGLIVCKSMSKVYALSGMRVAYLCGHPTAMAAMRDLTPPWIVGMAAQVAAVRALADPDYYARRYAQTRTFRAGLADGLRALGLRVLEGAANFVLAGSPLATAEELRSQCIPRGVYLRDVDSMGVHDERNLRIAVRSRDDNARIVSAIREALGLASPGPEDREA